MSREGKETPKDGWVEETSTKMRRETALARSVPGGKGKEEDDKN